MRNSPKGEGLGFTSQPTEYNNRGTDLPTALNQRKLPKKKV